MKKILFCTVILAAAIFLGSCDQPLGSNPSSTQGQESTLTVRVFDVGQADAILIKQGSDEMLIDAGNESDGAGVSLALNELGVDEIEYLVATHVHEDHIGGMGKIISDYAVKNIWIPSQVSTTIVWNNFTESIVAENVTPITPIVGTQVILGGAIVTVVGPQSTGYSDANDYSLVVKVNYGGNSMILMGDAESTSETELMNYGSIESDVLKIGHHGSSTSSSRDFIKAVNPRFAVVSVGAGNSYGHPAAETVERFFNYHIPLYRTDTNGTVTVSFGISGSVKMTMEKGVTPQVNPIANPYQESVQCIAMTQAGTRCLRMTTNLNGRCWQH